MPTMPVTVLALIQLGLSKMGVDYGQCLALQEIMSLEIIFHLQSLIWLAKVLTVIYRYLAA